MDTDLSSAYSTHCGSRPVIKSLKWPSLFTKLGTPAVAHFINLITSSISSVQEALRILCWEPKSLGSRISAKQDIAEVGIGDGGGGQ